MASSGSDSTGTWRAAGRGIFLPGHLDIGVVTQDGTAGGQREAVADVAEEVVVRGPGRHRRRAPQDS